jgi:thiol-disulfide isomerase/thioredoxin
MRAVRTLLPISSVRFSLLCAALLFAIPAAAQDSGLPIGSKAPTAVLKDVNGVAVDLGSIIGKRPVLLEFWATWCGNCKELEPTMLAIQKTHGRDVAIFAVAVPLNQSLERVKRYVEVNKYPFPMLWDADGEYAGAFEVPATSYVVLIDKAGRVAYTGVGGKQDLDAAIKKLR